MKVQFLEFFLNLLTDVKMEIILTDKKVFINFN